MFPKQLQGDETTASNLISGLTECLKDFNITPPKSLDLETKIRLEPFRAILLKFSDSLKKSTGPYPDITADLSAVLPGWTILPPYIPYPSLDVSTFIQFYWTKFYGIPTRSLGIPNPSKKDNLWFTTSQIAYVVKKIGIDIAAEMQIDSPCNGLFFAGLAGLADKQELVKIFMPYVKDVNFVMEGGGYLDTILHFAFANENFPLAKQIIDSAEEHKKEIDFNVVDNEGKTVLILACKLGSNTAALYLLDLKSKGKNIAINVQDKDGRTALHYACLLGMVEVAKKLVSLGANLTVTDNQGKTPVELCTAGLRGVATHLKSMGIDPSRDENAEKNHFYDAYGLNLRNAYRKERLYEVPLLVANQANVAQFRKLIETTPFFDSKALSERYEFKALDAEGLASLIEQTKTFTGRSKLDACMAGHQPLQEWAARHCAANALIAPLKKVIRQCPGSIYAVSPEVKRTALHFAAVSKKDSSSVCQLLLASGAEVNRQDHQGNTALHLACQQAKTDRTKYAVIEVLLKANADLTITNLQGKTAEDLFAELTDAPTNLAELFKRKRSCQSTDETTENIQKLTMGG
ncbi:MAG: hypothetical protein K0S08_154 [Gammaproteobacteria bacterium]|jgi:ankyrin repeat protein|nr:hypothetical protein [Gammaproteobacteria bacterium]